ncbi:MAG: hypothetical protein GMKNLPBB_01054 [Myxococcota bacterium]|nr:hypothetical protein [Myxococcota bacterium]
MNSRIRWLAAGVLLLAAAAAFARNPNFPNKNASREDLAKPENWPDDPAYKHEWQLWSFIPDALKPKVRAPEHALGTGMHADRAWQLTTGRGDVVIAVLDSGIIWSEKDLHAKTWLNKGELPEPQDKNGQSKPGVYDLNGDGIFNVFDYVEDPRVKDAPKSGCNAFGLRDPQDLIFTFSDGKDGDGNGYVDDISGWDAMWDDNDPYDNTCFDHGTYEAMISAAETNNGVGAAGTCPGCMVLHVRVGDSFVTDVNSFAKGTVFAVDSGAKVIQEALGTFNHTPAMQQAIFYAWNKGVITVASAADENSYHLNWPGGGERTIYVHAVRHDEDNYTRSTTFLNFANCTNFGGKLALSSPGDGCSSEATGRTAGQAGLIYSYALDLKLEPPLKTGEVFQLLQMSSDDIDVPESKTDPTKYASGPGWDIRFGYGRNNARNSLEMIRDGRIPPVADIVKPGWFSHVDAKTTTKIPVEAEIDASRYPSCKYVLEVAGGADPKDGWVTVKSESGLTAPRNGLIGEIDVAAIKNIPGLQPPGPESWNSFAVTVRLRVEADKPGQPPVKSEHRKTFFVHHDPDWLPGFPKWMGYTSGESSLKMADLDGDGKEELVFATADGLIHAMRADGGENPGWPAKTGLMNALDPANPQNNAGSAAFKDPAIKAADWRQSVVSTVAVGDLNGDGAPGLDVAAATLEGRIFAFNSRGEPLPGFPIRLPGVDQNATNKRAWLDNAIFGGVVLYDLNGDNTLEIIVAAGDQQVHAYTFDGKPLPGFPVLAWSDKKQGSSDAERSRIIGTPAIGLLDGDNIPDIVIGTTEVYDNVFARLYIIHGDGSKHPGGALHAGSPVSLTGAAVDVLPYVGRGIPTSPIIGDVTGNDGKPEIQAMTIAGPVLLFTGTGEQIIGMNSGTEKFGKNATSKQGPSLSFINNTSMGDMDNDGRPEIMTGTVSLSLGSATSGAKRAEIDHQVSAWKVASRGGQLEGGFLPGFPRKVEDYQFFQNYVVADISGDGLAEIISGTGGYVAHAVDKDGNQPANWPKFNGGWLISTPAVGDMNGDGYLEAATMTREGWLFIYKTKGPADGKIEWDSYHHDARNTGNHLTPLPKRKGPAGGGTDGGSAADGGAGPDAGPAADAGGEADAGSSDSGGSAAQPPKEDGCGCSMQPRRSGAQGPWMLALLAAALLAWRRAKHPAGAISG